MVADSQRQAAVVCSDMVVYSVVENSLQYLAAQCLFLCMSMHILIKGEFTTRLESVFGTLLTSSGDFAGSHSIA